MSENGDGTDHPAKRGALRRGARRVGRMFGFAWRHRGATGTMLLAIAIFAGGVWAGWFLRDRRAESRPVAVVVDRPVASAAGVASGSGAPNVLGLELDIARQVVLDAGVPASGIATFPVPAAGQPDRIVVQEPAPGVRIEGGAFRLGISQATTVPDVVGRSRAEARKVFDDLGARASTRLRYVAGAAAGTVVATEPPAGQPLDVDVTLVVASPPSSAFLTSLRPVEGNCNSGSKTISGQQFESSLICGASTSSTPRAIEYLLERKAVSLTYTLGQADDAKPGASVRVRAFVDGRQVSDETVDYGVAKAVTIDVTNGLRLRFEVSGTATSGSQSPAAVLGSAAIVSGPDEIASLTDRDG